jgi:hypothetical protein
VFVGGAVFRAERLNPDHAESQVRWEVCASEEGCDATTASESQNGIFTISSVRSVMDYLPCPSYAFPL